MPLPTLLSFQSEARNLLFDGGGKNSSHSVRRPGHTRVIVCTDKGVPSAHHSVETSRDESAVPHEKRYYVYILSSKGRVLYVGVTGFLMPRVLKHKAGEGGFTARYHVNRLV